MRRKWTGVKGTRMAVGVTCLGLAWALAAAGFSVAAATRRGTTSAATSTFVSEYPLSDAGEIDRYSLSDGRRLGVLVHIPRLRSTAMSSTVSSPHLLADGDYMLTVDHGAACRRARGGCHVTSNSCFSRVETVNPVSRRFRSLFSVAGAWRVLDAVPSPDDRSVALVERGCRGSATRLEVRDLAAGRSHLVTRQLSPCGLESDVTWDPGSTKLVFAFAPHPNLNELPAGCRLATAAAGGATGPASWALIRLRASCGFASSAFDSTGIVAIVGCSDSAGGTNTTLRQYSRRGRVLSHRRLDSFDPPQYGIATQLESDPPAHAVLVSEVVSDDPDVSDVWTWRATRLRQVGDYFGDAILAEP